MATMFLGGLWHGAAWTFVVWGLLHGAVLVVERASRPVIEVIAVRASRLVGFMGWLTTLTGVVIAWVFFRAEDLSGALTIVRLMFDTGAYSLTTLERLSYDDGLAMLMLAAIIALQNTLKDVPLTRVLSSLPWPALGVLLGLMLVLVSTTTGEGNAFIYFQF